MGPVYFWSPGCDHFLHPDDTLTAPQLSHHHTVPRKAQTPPPVSMQQSEQQIVGGKCPHVIIFPNSVEKDKHGLHAHRADYFQAKNTSSALQMFDIVNNTSRLSLAA